MALDAAFFASLGPIRLPPPTASRDMLREESDRPSLTSAEIGQVAHIANIRACCGGAMPNPYAAYRRPYIPVVPCPVTFENAQCWRDNHLVPLDSIDARGYPINPHEALPITDVYLPQWGPNHIANPIVTYFHREDTFSHIYLLVCDRKDRHHVSLPEGLVDAGDTRINTLVRELDERSARAINERLLTAPILYAGYVRSVLNTRHAWQETLVRHVHLGQAEASRIQLSGESLRWVRLTKLTIQLMYGAHAPFVSMAVANIFYSMQRKTR